MSTVVLVHGAWGRGEFWQSVVPHLEARGHRAVVVDQLPSAGSDPATLGDPAADVARVREVIDGLGDDAREDLVLVGHSRGGMVVAELAAHPAVRLSVYLAAFWPARGQSLLDLVSHGPPPDWWTPRDDGTAAITDDPDVLAAVLWHDADAETAAQAQARLQPLQSLAGLTAPSAAPERTHPATYIVCTQDRAIPVELQGTMARRADQVLRIDTAHCPMLSAPEELVAVLDRATDTGRTLAPSRRRRRPRSVEAPVEEVFRFVYDPRTFWSAMPMPTTQVGRPELTDVRLSEEGLGSFYTWTLTLLGRPADAINVITEFVPDRRFTDRSSRAIVGTWTTTVEPEGNGTRLTLQRHPSSNQVLARRRPGGGPGPGLPHPADPRAGQGSAGAARSLRGPAVGVRATQRTVTEIPTRRDVPSPG